MLISMSGGQTPSADRRLSPWLASSCRLRTEVGQAHVFGTDAIIRSVYTPSIAAREDASSGREAVIRLVLFAAIAILSSPSLVLADTGFLDRSVTANGETYRYQVYVPVEWTRAQKWPVVLYLHGNGGQGSDGSRHIGGASLPNEILEDRRRFPAVIVFPQAREGTWWSTPRMQEMALAAFDASVNEFNGDTDRFYLMGFSMGGGGVLRMALRFPSKFVALVEVSGGVVPRPEYPAARTNEDKKAHSYLSAPDPYAALAAAIKHLPVRVFHGDADEQVPVDHSRRLSAALKAANADVQYTEYPQTNHAGAAEKAWREPGLMSWLLAQRRKTGTN
jgi:predicted peptidase